MIRPCCRLGTLAPPPPTSAWRRAGGQYRHPAILLRLVPLVLVLVLVRLLLLALLRRVWDELLRLLAVTGRVVLPGMRGGERRRPPARLGRLTVPHGITARGPPAWRAAGAVPKTAVTGTVLACAPVARRCQLAPSWRHRHAAGAGAWTVSRAVAARG